MPSARIRSSISRSSAHILAISAVELFERRPCLKCAATTLFFPALVLGPVDFPPCIRHLVMPLTTGFLQDVLARVFAPQRRPGQALPSLVFLPARIKFEILAVFTLNIYILNLTWGQTI